MALLTSEITRIKYELGYNLLEAGAEPYISVYALFEQVVGRYMTSGAITTSSTTVDAEEAPTVVTIELADPTGFTPGDRIIVDLDGRQESSTAVQVVGDDLTLTLEKAHVGVYPVTVEGGESIVRELLARCRAASDKLAPSSGDGGAFGALKKVDEVEFYGAGNRSALELLVAEQDYWRAELASALGVRNLRKLRAGGGGCVALY